MPNKPPPAQDKGKPEVEKWTTPSSTGPKLPFPPPGNRPPVLQPPGTSVPVPSKMAPPSGSKPPIPPPGGQRPPSQGVSFSGIPPTASSRGAGAGPSPAFTRVAGPPPASTRGAGPSPASTRGAGPSPGLARGTGPSPAFTRGRGLLLPPRAGPPRPPYGGPLRPPFGGPPGMTGLTHPPIRGGMYRPRAPGQRRLGPFKPGDEAGEPFPAGSEDKKLPDKTRLYLGNIIRALEMIFSVCLIFLHGGYFFFLTKTSIYQLTSLGAFPFYLMARFSCSMYERRWIPDVMDAILSFFAALTYVFVCVGEGGILSSNPLGFLPNLKNLSLNQIAISIKLSFSGLLAGILLFDCFVHLTRAKNDKLFFRFR